MERDLALIELLSDGHFHSGEAIARHLGITRAAVWKALKKTAEELDLPLQSVRGRGYRLETPVELLNAGRLLESMSEAGRKRLAGLELHRRIDSTNAHLMRRAQDGAPSGLACLAERQTAGRGRRGRAWISPFGANLYLSLLWRSHLAPVALGGVSLAAGAAVAEVLRSVGAAELSLKWPNDVLWRRRKLAGLLLEVSGESQGPSCLVVGVGVNLRMAERQGRAIDQPWTTLEEILADRSVSRNRLAGRLLDSLLETLEQFERCGLRPFLDVWRGFDTFEGEPVRLLLGDRVIQGRHAGVASDGALLLDTPDGRRAFQAGEVSLRPVEGKEA